MNKKSVKFPETRRTFHLPITIYQLLPLDIPKLIQHILIVAPVF